MTAVKQAFAYDIIVSLVLYCPEANEVETCLDQILASRRRARVVVVDNSPTPVALRTRPADRVTVVITGSNIGYGRAHNRALALTRGEAPFHLIMNTDVSFCGDVIDEMIKFMTMQPAAGLSSPLIHYPDDRLQTSCRLLPTPANTIFRGFFDNSRWTREMNRRYELQDWNYNSVENIPSLPGCFMLVRSDIIEAVGGFDERFFLFAEDIDLSRRIFQISQCVFVPTSQIFHDLRSRVRFSWRRHVYKVVNFIRYFNKWGWIRDSERKKINDRTHRRLCG